MRKRRAAQGVAALRPRRDAPERNKGRNVTRPKKKTYDQSAIRSIVDQHNSHSLARRGATGQIRTSGHADGPRAVGLYQLEPCPAVPPGGSDLAQPRSDRAL